ncbi:ABC transporter permease [Sphingobacterium suaedae]|uniref:ABC transporter permease n=1 Tax=Sphingobacterium suaedae TaxID=1686402 RepID=A0ABW5KJV2_9SPHI
MIQNYIKMAWRNLMKHKLYALIKVGGFAFSIAACILITRYIIYETSYDSSYTYGDQIYRIVGRMEDKGTIRRGTSFQAPLSKAIQADFPEIELVGRILPNALFYGAGSNQVSTERNNESVYEEGFTYMDQQVLDMLELPVVFGQRDQALTAPYSLVMTESKAAKLFPEQNPVGKLVYLNGDRTRPYTVKAVIADIPDNSHLKTFHFFLTLNGVVFYPGEQENWGATNYPMYVKLKKGTDIPQFEKKLTQHIRKNYWIPQLAQGGNSKAAQTWSSVELSLQPIRDIYLHSNGIEDYKNTPQSDIRLIWLFGAITAFILLIACVNFINLSTAKSANRAKEVGLRKVVGSRRSDLIFQFLCESMLYSVLSFVIGILIAWLTLPLFNELAGKQLHFPWSDSTFILLLLLSAILVGLIAGIYPAFYLSKFRPAAVFKGELRQGRSPVLRNSLVIFQFATSVVLIIGTLIVNHQLHFILTKKIGFEKDQVLVLQGTATLGNHMHVLQEEIARLPQVKSMTVSDYLPVQAAGVKRNGNSFWKEGKIDVEPSQNGQIWEVDENYIPTLGMQLVAGRNFQKDRASDSSAVVINETLAKNLGLENPVGARITNGMTYTVIGVVRDFHFETLKDEIGGICLSLGNSPTMLAVKLQSKDIETSLKALSMIWKRLSPNQAMRYTFLDESYAHMYADVKRTGAIFSTFASLAIFIACLGLFGLAAFTTEQRVKEIGIRKVLGASIQGIVQLLTRDFLRLVIIAIVIASPIAWWMMNTWLADFVYRIAIPLWIFVAAGAAAIFIALVTVSYQAIKAAQANPVDSLRNE